MEREVYYSNLYDCYNQLLTDKQKIYFEDYYFNNLTLSEMSENYNISRNAIHKALKEVCLKLDDYEKKLKIYEKNTKILEIIEDEKLKKRIEEIINMNN